MDSKIKVNCYMHLPKYQFKIKYKERHLMEKKLDKDLMKKLSIPLLEKLKRVMIEFFKTEIIL